MPAEDHFISRGLLKVKINDYLRRELRRAGYAGLDLQKTPLGMRVIVYAARPGMVIGRRGATVRELTETMESVFGLEAPQIEVSEIEIPELNGDVMAERLAQRLERGDHFRRAAYGVLRRIIGAGAIGCEISIKGKLTSRRARYQTFRSGFVAKTGEPVRTNVSHGIAFAILKPGILGVQIRIMLPDAVAPDRPAIVHKEMAPPITEAEAGEAPEFEVTEEEGPISEAELAELLAEGEIPSSEVVETEPTSEPTVSEEHPALTTEPEIVQPEPVMPELPVEEKDEKPKPKKKAKPKKPKAKVEEKPEKPKAKEKPVKKPREKAEKPKAKKKAEPKAKKPAATKTKEKVEAKPKVKGKTTEKEAKPKAKTKAKSSKEETSN